MNIKDLKKEIPFKWRVQSFNKHKPQATCVAYIDARDVEDLLDEVAGAENWQDEYYQVKNTMVCKIGIKMGEEWVWKSDGGTESDVEAEKGELSDAFKRAAVKWGIGRFLYSKEVQYVGASEVKNQTNYPYVVDENGERIWNLTEHLNNRKGYKQPSSVSKPLKKPSKPLPAGTPTNCSCGGTYSLKEGSYGQFLGCSNYPKCKIKAPQIPKTKLPQAVSAEEIEQEYGPSYQGVDKDDIF